jgi:hypothetical protein
LLSRSPPRTDPYDVKADAAGSLYIADTWNNLVRKVSPLGVVVTIAGGGGQLPPSNGYGFGDGYGTLAGLYHPVAIHVDANGFVYTADFGTCCTPGTLPGAFPSNAIADVSLIRVITPSFSAASVCDGKWHAVATTHSASGVSNYYVDGALQLQVVQRPWTVTPPPNALRIGSNGDPTVSGGEYYVGALDELRVYSRALSAAEVLQLSEPPFASFANAVVPPLAAGSSQYTVVCSAGYTGPVVNYTKSAADNSWAASTPVLCTVCPAGYFSVAGNTTQCTACAAGLYGASAGAVTAQCSGTCSAGSYCPLASTSPTQLACGGAGLFCPQGSAAPTAVAAGYYSTPVEYPAAQRMGQCPCVGGDGATCPAFSSGRTCFGGLLLPAVDLSQSCYGGLLYVEVTDSMSNVVFGPNITVQTPGMTTPAVSWSGTTPVVGDGTGCATPTLVAPVVSNGGLTLQMGVSIGGSGKVDAISCASGFTFNLVAARAGADANDAIYSTGLVPAQTSCQVIALVTPSLAPPVLGNCTSLNVPERVPIGTSFGSVISVKGSSQFSSFSYFIQTAVASPNPGVVAPFGVDCTGALFSARNVVAAQASSYNLTLRVDNTAGGQTFSSFCNIVVGIVPKPVAPSVTRAALSTFDLVPNGTVVGNVGLVNNNNIVGQTATYASVARWAARDTPDAFAIDAQGNVTVSNAVLDTTQKTTYYYTLNASDAVSWATYPVVISLLPTPRPPITFAQTFSIFEGSAANTPVPNGRLAATHPQAKSMVFALVQPSFPFVCSSGGDLSVSPLATTAPATLQFNLQPTYVLTFTVRDSSGIVSTSTATINLLPTNLPPVFSQPAGYAKVASEGLPSGVAVDTPLYAMDPNPNDINSFAVLFCSPLLSVNGTSGVCPFGIDQSTGQIKVSAIVPGGALKADANKSITTDYAPYAPFTYVLVVSCFDNGVPVKRSTVNVTVKIANIVPRWVAPAITISVPAAQQQPGALVFSSLANTWAPYDNAAPPPNNFSVYSVISAASNASAYFALDYNSGQLTVKQGVALNYNVAPLGFVMVLQIQDSRTNLFSRTTLTVKLVHVNRAPIFTTSGPLFVPTGSTGAVGPYMPNFVLDLDLAVIAAEKLTWSITPCSPACNSTGLFTIDAVTGQVLLPGQIDNGGPSQKVYTVNITVVDAGIDSSPPGLRYSAWSIFNFVMRDGAPRPYFVQSSFAINIPENTAFGTAVTTLQGYYNAPGVTLAFTMQPTGTLVGAAFPFGITTVPTGVGSGDVAVKWDGRSTSLSPWANLDFEAPAKAAALGGAAAGFSGFNVFTLQVVATDSNTGDNQETGCESTLELTQRLVRQGAACFLSRKNDSPLIFLPLRRRKPHHHRDGRAREPVLCTGHTRAQLGDLHAADRRTHALHQRRWRRGLQRGGHDALLRLLRQRLNNRLDLARQRLQRLHGRCRPGRRPH